MSRLVNLSFLINGGFVQSLLFALFLAVLFCFVLVVVGVVVSLLLGFMSRHKRVRSVLVVIMFLVATYFVLSFSLSLAFGPGQGIHCNYKARELWIVEDRAADKIWRTDDIWYHLFCGIDDVMFDGKRLELDRGLLKMSLLFWVALFIALRSI